MRTRVSDLRAIGRNTQGVRLIKVDEGDKLVALAKVEPDDTEEITPAAADPSETPPEPQTPPTDQPT
jgi:DNA gyrase subunit A